LLVRRARTDRPLADLARALDTSWPTAKRLEDPRHSLTLKQLEQAAAALGKRLVLSFE
jgi:antitoxin HicB